MKHTSIYIFIALLLFSSSCNKEQSPLQTKPQEQTLPDAKILQFESVQDLENTVNKIIHMTDAERMEWYKLKGDFQSQEQEMWDVVDKIDQAKSLEEIQSIQAAYSKRFLFNTNPKDEDLSPYIPSSKPGYSLVCNPDGEVEINGKIFNFNDLTSFEQTNDYKILNQSAASKGPDPEIREEVNAVYARAGKRKFWAEAYRLQTSSVPAEITLKLTAHKKGTFGWNKYSSRYNIQQVARVASTWSAFYFPFWDDKQSFWTKELKTSTWMPIGQPAVGKNALMTILIYSEGITVLYQRKLIINC